MCLIKITLIKLLVILGNPCTSGENNSNDDGTNDDNLNNDTSLSGDEWSTPQNPITLASEIALDSPKYGFANKISGALNAFEVSELNNVLMITIF